MIGKAFGRYKILRTLGSGTTGDLYQAQDTTCDRKVALRVCPAEFADKTDSSQWRARFQSEVRAVAALSHPNVMGIDDFGEEQGVPYVVMELLEGQTLRERLEERRLSPVEAVEYARQIAEGMAAAHGRGITHRDLKPANVFITKAGKVKVFNFGLIGRSGDEPETGTVSYRSPEQIKKASVDPRSDVFAFGAVLYEMLSGEAPFDGNSSAETMAAILHNNPPDLSTSASLPPSLGKIVSKCLKKDPAERFPSARDVAAAIDALSEERTTERPPVVDDEPSPRRKWKFF